MAIGQGGCPPNCATTLVAADRASRPWSRQVVVPRGLEVREAAPSRLVPAPPPQGEPMLRVRETSSAPFYLPDTTVVGQEGGAPSQESSGTRGKWLLVIGIGALLLWR